MNTEVLDLFCDVHEALASKNEYDKRLKAYRELPVSRRLLSRRPADPVRGVSKQELCELAEFALFAAFPAMESVDKDGKRTSVFRTFNVHDDGTFAMTFTAFDPDRKLSLKERFEMEPGLGLVHSYHHDSDPDTNERNRHHAKVFACSERLHSAPFGLIYKDLDRFCCSPQIARASVLGYSVEKKLNLSSITTLRRLRRDSDLQMAQVVSVLQDFRERNKDILDPKTVSDLVNARLGALCTTGIVARGDESHKMFDILRHDAFTEACRKVDALEAYKVFDLARKRSEYPSTKEVMQLSAREAKLMLKDPSHLSNLDYFTLQHFVENAYIAGCPETDIVNAAEAYCERHHLGAEFKPSYEYIFMKVADNYVSTVLEQTDTAFGKGVREAARIDIQTPYGLYEKKVQQVSDLMSARAFLNKHDGVGPFSLGENGEVVKCKPVFLGAYAFKSGSEVSLNALSVLAGCPLESLRKGYSEAFGNEILKELSGGMSLPKTSSVPVNILAKDMLDTVSYLRNTDIGKASQFMSDIGAKPVRGEMPALAGIVEAAKRMYDGGSLRGSLQTSDFREKWEEFITAARKAGLQNQQQLGRKMKNKGIKLS